MKSVTEYPFSIASGGTYTLPAMGDYFRIQSSTGTLNVTVEGAGTLPNLLSGQGIKNTPFQRLVLVNTSGALNTGTILIASEEFVDNRTFGVNDLSAGTINTLRQPLTATGFFTAITPIAANTPDTIFSPGSNVNGAILLSASFGLTNATSFPVGGFITKTSAPTSVVDGTPNFASGSTALVASTYTAAAQMPCPQFIPAGQGLYFITDVASGGQNGGNARFARFRLL